MTKYIKNQMFGIKKASSRKEESDASVKIVASYDSIEDYLQKHAAVETLYGIGPDLDEKLKQLPGFETVNPLTIENSDCTEALSRSPSRPPPVVPLLHRYGPGGDAP